MDTVKRKLSVGGVMNNRVPIALVLAQMTQMAGLPISTLWSMPAAEWMFAVSQGLGRVQS